MNPSIFDELLVYAIHFLEANGWYILAILVLCYAFELPRRIARLPGAIFDYFFGERRKKVLDFELRDIRAKQQQKALERTRKSD